MARVPRHRLVFPMVVVVLAISSGCSTLGHPTKPHPLRDNRNSRTARPSDFARNLLFVPNRLMDLAEMIRAGATAGPGLGFEIRLTRFVQLGAMGYADAGLAWEGRRRAAYRFGTHWRASAGPWDMEYNDRDRWARPDWEFSFEAHLFGSLRFALDWAEVADMLLGWVGLDILHDDFDYR